MRYDLRHGDCLELMKNVPDGSVDMILCDLPYGTTACKWDVIIPFEPLWMQYERIIKGNGAIVLTASQPFSSVLVSSNIKKFRYGWIWEKNMASNAQLANKQPMKIHEDILVFSLRPHNYYPQGTSPHIRDPKRNGKNSNGNLGHFTRENVAVETKTGYPKTVLKYGVERGIHPTQKPIPLFEYLIKTYTNENELVLDNCMGSGTTGVACKRLKRRFIGIEKEAKYFEIATKRIQETIEGAGCAEMAAGADKGSVGKKNINTNVSLFGDLL